MVKQIYFIDMVTLYVVVSGQDERFALKAIIRRGLAVQDRVVVAAGPGEGLSRKLAELGFSATRVEPPTTAADAFALFGGVEGRVVLVLGVGAPLVSAFLLVGAACVLGLEGEVEVGLADGSSLIWPLMWFRPLGLGEVELGVLRGVSLGMDTLAALSSHTKLSRSTVWRRLQSLVKRGLVEYDGRRVRLTEFGRLVLGV